MDYELYPKGSERPEKRHDSFSSLEKSPWLCCGRKGLGVVVVRMGDMPQSRGEVIGKQSWRHVDN